LVSGGRLPWLCEGSGIVVVPASNEIFHDIALVLTPDDTTNMLPFIIRSIVEDTISRDSAYAQAFSLRSRISKLLLNVWCIRFLQQLSTIEAAFVQNFSENGLVSYIYIALPASAICLTLAYSVRQKQEETDKGLAQSEGLEWRI
jgi:hypothetical protein